MSKAGKAAGGAVSGAATGVFSKIKETQETYKSWDKEIVRTRPLVLPDNVSNQVVYKGKGGGVIQGKFATLANDGKIVLTRKCIEFYDVPFGKSFIPGKKHDASKLVYTIDLASIDSFKKESNRLGVASYSITANGEECVLDFGKEASKFVLYITRLAGLDGNMLNINLREGEKVIDTGNVKVKTGGLATIATGGWMTATMYLTNQRIIINKSYNEVAEGAELLFDKERSSISEITEEKNAMNCVYTIKGPGEPIILKFPGVVPGWFLALVKNGEGNAKQLKRKGNLMKGAKVAMIAASLLGASGDVDADVDDDVDVDVDDDFDVDGDMVDMDGDGIDDTMMVDTDGDGLYDSAMIDTDGDGSFDAMAVDVDGDGSFDAIGMDTDGDGAIDTMAVDADGDGALDTVAVDVDGDGSIDAVGMDTDGDGAIDTVAVDDSVGTQEYTAVDVDGDGTIDAVGVDTDGDGAIDTIGVDTDGDGTLDTVAVDMDGDGTVDAIGVDTDGDGAIDTVGVDTDGDGAIDSIGMDTDGDGAIDTIGMDTDGDGAVDTIGVDTDGDGAIDAVGVDVDGDGSIDAVGVDIDGDGTIDKVGIDSNGDGTIDTFNDIDHGAADHTPMGMVGDDGSGSNPIGTIVAGAAVVAGAAGVAKAAKAAQVKNSQPNRPQNTPANVRSNVRATTGEGTTPPPTPPAPTQLKEEEPKKKGKTGLIIGIIAGVLALGAIIGFLVMNNKKKAMLREQMLIEQMTDPSTYPWLHGEWRNGVYGDILDIYSDSVKFVKNGLVFEDEGDEYMDEMRPKSVEALTSYLVYTDKVPFELNYEKTGDGSPLVTLQFDRVVSSYPSVQTEGIVIGLDTDNQLLYYTDPNGKKVFLDKYSDNTFEEKWDSELAKAREQLAQDLANHQYDWLYGTWLDFNGEPVVVNQDYVYSGNNKQPFSLHYELEDPYSEMLDYGLYLYLCDIKVEPSMRAMYWADEYGFYEYQRVSDATEPTLKVYSNASDGFTNIRQSPESNAPIVGVLRNGPEGAILLGTVGEWKHINCNGIEGYVFYQCVQDTPTEVFQDNYSTTKGSY